MSSANFNGAANNTSSGESSLEGYSFVGKNIINKRNLFRPIEHPEQLLYNAVKNGDLEALKKQLTILNWKVDNRVQNGFTLLMHACASGSLDIISYLVIEKEADVNCNVDSYVPLMVACDYLKNDGLLVEIMVRFLLAHGAMLDCSNQCGITPLIIACKKGYINVVRHMLENDVSLDAMDNDGRTAIFHAIQNNHVEIVKILAEAGANKDVTDKQGFTPMHLAEQRGLHDLLKSFSQLGSGSDVLGSSICPKSECPEHFQEVDSVLTALGMQKYIECFAKDKVSLGEYLSMSDDNLEKLGTFYPCPRSRVKKAILDFHLYDWSKQSITGVNINNKDNGYDILWSLANQVRHLVIIQAALKYIEEYELSGEFANCDPQQIENFRQNLNAFHGVVNEITKTVKILSSFNPDCHGIVAKRNRQKIYKFFKYAPPIIALGVSAFICFKRGYFDSLLKLN